MAKSTMSWGGLSAVNHPMQFGILHVMQNTCWIVKFAIVQIRKRGDRFGVDMVTTAWRAVLVGNQALA